MPVAKKEDIDVKKFYGQDCISTPEEFIKNNNVNIKGLNDSQVIDNISKYGNNEIKQSKPKKWYNYFLRSLLSPFNIILLLIAATLVYTDVVVLDKPSYANIIVIIILVLASTFLEFVQEYRSNKAAEKLKELVGTTTTVIRDNKEIKISIKNITTNDIIILSAGDMIPADLRVIESKDLFISQSSITGESDAVKKLAKTEIPSIDMIESITDLDTICFMGTNVISGSGKAVVIKVGDHTYFGKVAHTLIEGKPKTAFEKGIESISKLLMRFMLVMIPIAFLLNAWKQEILNAFTFSVAIAIGITPLLLPVILSSSLSKGAIRMSKKKTIVKKLDSIQSFGAMNILCTDKTGTLTEDRIVLERYLDVYGNEDMRVLKHAFLNSYFQTGLKGNIDEAVINKGRQNELEDLEKRYKKIDEIPFDFTRRRLSVVVTDGEKNQLITKGAVEEILSICTMFDHKGEVSKLTDEIKENIIEMTRDLNRQGLRVVGVCQKNDIKGIKSFGVEHENEMVLMGFVGFLDPPKESAKRSIDQLNKLGIRVIVLTGDNEEITRAICEKVDIKTSTIVLGSEIDKLEDVAVEKLLRHVNVFAKLSPIQKARLVRLLKEMGNVVGYMGDGINDTPSLTNSDVGISVDTAVDIAKETADIILLEKDLDVLIDGALEGRKTFTNLLKYIKLAISFNFGEVSSVLIASVLLPFFPITPIQLLVQSLLYDMGQLSLPFDNVDDENIKKPKKLDTKEIKRFMVIMGPLSSCFDLIVFATLWFGFKLRIPDAALFQTIWFSYGVVSNLVGMHVIRTGKMPFIQSHASKSVYATTIILSVAAILVPFTFVGRVIGLVAIPAEFISVIILVPILYCFVALIAKKQYIKKYGEWI